MNGFAINFLSFCGREKAVRNVGSVLGRIKELGKLIRKLDYFSFSKEGRKEASKTAD